MNNRIEKDQDAWKNCALNSFASILDNIENLDESQAISMLVLLKEIASLTPAQIRSLTVLAVSMTNECPPFDLSQVQSDNLN